MRMSTLLEEVRKFSVDEGFSPKEIKMAIGIASDPRYAKGNMTGAVTAIEKMKKGLSKHPQVMAVLKRQNEDIDEAVSPAQQAAIAISKKERGEKPKKEEVQEDGHTDVASAQNNVKVAMSALTKMSGELAKLNPEDALPSWWTNKVAVAVDKLDGMADYLDTQVEALDTEDEPKVKEIIKKLKGASKAHAGQADDLEKAVKEEVELDEAMKYTHVAVDSKGKLIGLSTKESDAVDMARRNKGKALKLKKPISQKKGDMMVNRTLGGVMGDAEIVRNFNEEVELDEVTMSQALDIDPKDVARMKTLAVLYTRAMKLPSGSPKQDKFKKEIEKLRKELRMDESVFQELVKSIELDEAKYDLYHKDFSSAMQHAYAMAKKLHGVTIDPKEIDDKVATGPKKPSKGKTNSYRLKGKGGAIQVQVANLDDKKFELNMYKEEVELDESLLPLFFGLWMAGAFLVLPGLMVYDIVNRSNKRGDYLDAKVGKIFDNMISKFKKDKNYKPTSAEVDAAKKLEKEVKSKEPSIFKKAMEKLKSIKSKSEEVELDEVFNGTKKDIRKIARATDNALRKRSTQIQKMLKSKTNEKGRGLTDFEFDHISDEGDAIAAELVYRKKRGKDPISDDIPSHLKKFVNEEVELPLYVELDEMKMNDPKLLKVFDKLKKGSTVKLKTSSTINKGKDFVEYIVKSKNTVNKGRVEKITLATVGNEGAVKKFLYKRDGTVGFAIGDMGASIDDIKEETNMDAYVSRISFDEGAAADARRDMRRDPDMKSKRDSEDVSATTADVEKAANHIIMQLRKSVSMKGQKDVEFASGKQKVPPQVAQKILDMYNKQRTSADKSKFQMKIAKSYKDLLTTVKGR